MRRSIGTEENTAERTPHADAHKGGDVPEGDLRRSRDWDAVDETLLIAKVRRMIRAIGLPNTVLLLETLGGTYLELPQGRLWRKHRGTLATLIGDAAADAFHREFAHGERRILLPKVDKLLIQIRDRRIWDEADDGMSVREQALKYRLTMRQIQKIRRRRHSPVPCRPTPQLPLFPSSGPGDTAGSRRNSV